MAPRGITRRFALGAAALLPLSAAVAACGSDALPEASEAGDPSGPEAGLDGDTAVMLAGNDEWVLVARYEATIAAHPGLAPTLSPLRDHHLAHASALGAPRPDPLPATGTVPASQAKAIALLAAAESAARTQRIDACTSATSAELAGVLVQVAASEAAHAAYLAGVSA